MTGKWTEAIQTTLLCCNNESVYLAGAVRTFGGFGGYSSLNTQSAVYMDGNGNFNLTSDQHTTMGEVTLSIKRYDNTTSVLNGKAYIIGGHFYVSSDMPDFTGNVGSVVEMFTPDSNAYNPFTNTSGGRGSMTRLPDAPFNLQDLTSSVLNGKIYVTGGVDNVSGLDQKCAWSFDGTNWVQLPDMNYARSAHSMITYANKVYAIGGRGDAMAKSTIECFDGTSWTVLQTSIPTPRWHHGSVILGTSLYILGGLIDDSNGTTIDTVEIFNFADGTWSNGENLPSILSRFGVAKISDREYMTAFGWITGGGSTLSWDEYLNQYEVDTYGWWTDSATGRKYYFAPTQLTSYGGTVYQAGQMIKSDWLQIDSQWYYFRQDGMLLTGWFQTPNSANWYYGTTTAGVQYGGIDRPFGACYENEWLNYQGGWYWFHPSPSCKMACSETININGKDYIFASNGVCQNP